MATSEGYFAKIEQDTSFIVQQVFRTNKAMVVWQTCSKLTQRSSQQQNPEEKFQEFEVYYSKQILQIEGVMSLQRFLYEFVVTKFLQQYVLSE